MEEVAARLGISWQMYQRYELATGRLPADVLLDLADIFNVDVKMLVSPAHGPRASPKHQPSQKP
jgi:transcriptional regulator with XRE-family HTH domain